jgi:hypothetical protein
MADLQDDSIERLFSGLQADLGKGSPDKELDFRARYGEAIRSMGEVAFLCELFRRWGDSTLLRALTSLSFVWKDLPFSSWQQILQHISGDIDATYQFVWFAAPYLGLDILSMIRNDPNVHDTARDLIRRQFPEGAPESGGELEQEVLTACGVDPHALWRRLEQEGAPMHR